MLGSVVAFGYGMHDGVDGCLHKDKRDVVCLSEFHEVGHHVGSA